MPQGLALPQSCSAPPIRPGPAQCPVHHIQPSLAGPTSQDPPSFGHALPQLYPKTCRTSSPTPSALAHPSSPTPGPPEPGLPQAFFCGRSDYFRALLDDHFQENEELEVSGGLPAITLHGISPELFTHVLYYIYSDHTEVGPQVVPDGGASSSSRTREWGEETPKGISP